MDAADSRYRLVTRRALLKASAGLGAALILPACGNDDAQVFAGALTDAVAPPSAATNDANASVPTEPIPLVETPGPAQASTAEAEPTVIPESVASAEPTPAPDPSVATEPTPVAESTAVPEPTAAPTSTPTPEPTAAPLAAVAVAGEMIVSFTYTQGATGKNERPYIAVWIENAAGELLTTVALWYQQRRRGERWLDHLDRWWDRDQLRIAGGGGDTAAAISSATRQAGSYAVAWDGAVGGTPASPGQYYLCVESAREEGPYSLVREALELVGSLAETALPGNGELSAVTARTSV